jgi:ethanolamine ammonia-lyase small subunit
VSATAVDELAVKLAKSELNASRLFAAAERMRPVVAAALAMDTAASRYEAALRAGAPILRLKAAHDKAQDALQMAVQRFRALEP